jgi:hypothetical protein
MSERGSQGAFFSARGPERAGDERLREEQMISERGLPGAFFSALAGEQRPERARDERLRDEQ